MGAERGGRLRPGGLPLRRRRALIAGGGVGGLAAALALTRAGWEAKVFERAPTLGEVGAGLQLGANGYRALAALGLADRVAAGAWAAPAIEMRRGVGGGLLTRIPLGGRWGAPHLCVHRADLIEALAATLPEGVVETGVEAGGLAPEGALRLASGAEFEGDLVIGADGLRSRIRETMLGPEAPRFTGYVAWRATVPAAAAPSQPPAVTAWAGKGRHAVTYPLRGGRLVNFVGIVGEDWRKEGWTEPGDPAALRALFGDWAAPVAEIVRAAEAPFRWALFDRPRLPRWSEGRAVLLGDAAHPMLPSLAQGAAQALEDAVALASRLEAAEPEAALPAHYAARIGRVSRVQDEARANLRRFHSDGAVFGAGVRLAHALAPGWFERRLDWLYGAEV